MKLSPLITILLLSILLFNRCKTQKNILASDISEIYNSELRISKINSSMDAVAYMYERFGEWDVRQQNLEEKFIKPFVWHKVDLLENGKEYTIITSGVETMSEYFASFIIKDQEGKYCLPTSHEDSVDIIKFLVGEVTKLKVKNKTYLLIKQNL